MRKTYHWNLSPIVQLQARKAFGSVGDIAPEWLLQAIPVPTRGIPKRRS